MAEPQQPASSSRSGNESTCMPTSSVNTSINQTLLQRCAQNPHRIATNIAMRNMYEDEKLKIVCKTGVKKNPENYAIGCELNNL